MLESKTFHGQQKTGAMNRLWASFLVGAAFVMIAANHPQSDQSCHTVVYGDSLYKIARTYNTTIDAIKQANGLASNIIRIGQRLCFSGTGNNHVASDASAPSDSTEEPRVTARIWVSNTHPWIYESVTTHIQIFIDGLPRPGIPVNFLWYSNQLPFWGRCLGFNVAQFVTDNNGYAACDDLVYPNPFSGGWEIPLYACFRAYGTDYCADDSFVMPCFIKGNISFTTSERIYHVPSGEFYDATVINPAYGERWVWYYPDSVDSWLSH